MFDIICLNGKGRSLYPLCLEGTLETFFVGIFITERDQWEINAI